MTSAREKQTSKYRARGTNPSAWEERPVCRLENRRYGRLENLRYEGRTRWVLASIQVILLNTLKRLRNAAVLS